MQRMTELYKQIVELKKTKMELLFASFASEKDNQVKQIRMIKADITKASVELHKLRKGMKK